MEDIKKEHERYKKEHYERKKNCMTDQFNDHQTPDVLEYPDRANAKTQ